MEAVIWVRAESGHLSKSEDPDVGVQSESQIPFRTLAMYLGCAEGYRILPAALLSATA